MRPSVSFRNARLYCSHRASLCAPHIGDVAPPLAVMLSDTTEGTSNVSVYLDPWFPSRGIAIVA